MKKDSAKINLHFLLIAAIALVFVACIVRLLLWNRGEDTGFDPTAVTTEFDTEPLDLFFLLTPDKLEGHPDDGVNTILFLGNDPLTTDVNEYSLLADVVAEKTGAVTYNAGFWGSTLSAKSRTYIDTVPSDAFTLAHLTQAFCSRDFSLQESAISEIDAEFREPYGDALQVLKNADVRKLDTLVLFYDAADMLNYRPVSDVRGIQTTNISTVCGALGFAIQNIQETYPYLRIVIMSPFFCYSINDDGFYSSLDTEDYGHGSLPNYLLHVIDVAKLYDVSLIDNYYGTITELNATDYLTDNFQLNEEGVRLLADRLIRFLRLLPEGG
mgnify:CR=1 FL=1